MSAEEALAGMEQTRQAVAALTGVRQQFIDAGWAPENAERMVIELLAAETAKAKGGRK